MEHLICYCLKCKSELARFSNSWDAIGTSYHSPVQAPIAIIGLEVTGSAYGAAPDSSIEMSSLQDVACSECRTTLGLQCYSAPSDHLLKKDQFILNLSLMSVISKSTSKKAIISVAKSIPLTKSSSKRPPLRQRASTSQPIRIPPQSVPPPSRPPVPLFPSKASAISSVDTSIPLPPVQTSYHMSDVESFQSWAKCAIQNQQKEIEKVSGTVDRIEKDMQSLRSFMEEVRAELASNRDLQRQTHENVQSLRTRVTEMSWCLRSREGTDLPSKKFDAITEDISLVNQKESEVDQVKADLTRMRDRLKSLEQPTDNYGLVMLPQLTLSAPASKTAAIQPNATVSVSSTKRRLDKPYKHQTPSADPRLISNHPSKRTKFSHDNMDDSLNDELSVEAPGIDAMLICSAKPGPSQQDNSSPHLPNSSGRNSRLESYSGNIEAPLPINTPKISKTSKHRPKAPTTALAQARGTPIPGKIQLRNTTPEEADKHMSDIAIELPLSRNFKRNPTGSLMSVNEKTNRRSLRRKKSNLVPDLEYKGLNEVDNLAVPDVQIETKNMEEEQTAEEFTIVVDAECLLRPSHVIAARSGENQVTSSVEIEQSSPLTPLSSVNPRLRQLMNSVEPIRPSTPVSIKPAPTRLFNTATVTPAPEGKSFKCGVCKQRFPSFYALTFHHQNNEGCEDKSNDDTPVRLDTKPFKCGGCRKAYTNISSLNYHHEHSKTCTDNTYDILPTCPSCGRSYKVVFNYERHIEFGACSLNGTSSELKDPLWTCNACGKPFKTKSEIERHRCSQVKLHSLNFREASLAARELALVERERIVRQTLEREMMDIRR